MVSKLLQKNFSVCLSKGISLAELLVVRTFGSLGISCTMMQNDVVWYVTIVLSPRQHFLLFLTPLLPFQLNLRPWQAARTPPKQISPAFGGNGGSRVYQHLMLILGALETVQHQHFCCWHSFSEVTHLLRKSKHVKHSATSAKLPALLT